MKRAGFILKTEEFHPRGTRNGYSGIECVRWDYFARLSHFVQVVAVLCTRSLANGQVLCGGAGGCFKKECET